MTNPNKTAKSHSTFALIVATYWVFAAATAVADEGCASGLLARSIVDGSQKFIIASFPEFRFEADLGCDAAKVCSYRFISKSPGGSQVVIDDVLIADICASVSRKITNVRNPNYNDGSFGILAEYPEIAHTQYFFLAGDGKLELAVKSYHMPAQTEPRWGIWNGGGGSGGRFRRLGLETKEVIIHR